MDTLSLNPPTTTYLPADLRDEIDQFAAFLDRIEQMPVATFERQFYSALRTIDALVASYQAEPSVAMAYLQRVTADAFTHGRLQSRARSKPLGYAGDFLLIDWMYTQEHGPEPRDHCWDAFYHRQDAAGAVRNRKGYFADVFAETCDARRRPVRVLDLACGPCRDVIEAVARAGDRAEGSQFHCVDIEPQAIAYARGLSKTVTAPVTFEWDTRNVFRLRPTQRYDLVWSAGLFDYLNDRLAVGLIARMWSWTAPGGQLVFGNFHPRNPTRPYMEWGTEWFLIHRAEDDLRRLAIEAGIPPEAVTIRPEALSVCVFCHATRPA